MFSSRPLRRTTPRISGGRPPDVPRTWQRTGPVVAAGVLLALLAVFQPATSGARREAPAAPAERVQLRARPVAGQGTPEAWRGAVHASGARREAPAAPAERTWQRTGPVSAPALPALEAGRFAAAGAVREPERLAVRSSPLVGPQIDGRHAIPRAVTTVLRPDDVPRTLVVRGWPVHGDLHPAPHLWTAVGAGARWEAPVSVPPGPDVRLGAPGGLRVGEPGGLALGPAGGLRAGRAEL